MSTEASQEKIWTGQPCSRRVSGSEIDSLIKKVEAALGEAVSRFRVDLQKKGAPAGKPGPIR